jgi:hypothetical protein
VSTILSVTSNLFAMSTFGIAPQTTYSYDTAMKCRKRSRMDEDDEYSSEDDMKTR